MAEASLQLVRDELHFEMGIATEDPAVPARTLSEFCFGGQADPPAEDLLSWKMNVSLALQKFLRDSLRSRSGGPATIHHNQHPIALLVLN